MTQAYILLSGADLFSNTQMLDWKKNFYSEISDGQNNNLSISIISIPSKNYTYTSMAA